MAKRLLICCLGLLSYVGVACKNAEPPNTIQVPSPSPIMQSPESTKLENDVFEFLSLEPHAGISEIKEGFHSNKVLGKIIVSDKKDQARLLAEMRKGLVAAKKAGRGSASCFDPRHGIHIVERGKVTDYVICFACWGMEKYVNNVFVNSSVISNVPEPFFDAILSKAGIPLAAKFY